MDTNQQASTAGGKADNTEAEAVAQNNVETGAQDAAKKDKPKREKRSAKSRGNAKKAEEGKQETRYQ